MDEVLFYKILDIICTVNESVICLLFMAAMTDKDIRSKRNAWIIVWYLIIILASTYLVTNMPLKSVLITTGLGIVWCIVKKWSLLRGLCISCLAMGWIGTIQGSITFVLTFLIGNPAFDMGNFHMTSWQYSVVSETVCMCLTVLFYQVFQNCSFRWENRDLILVGIMGYLEIAAIAFSIENFLKQGIQARGELLLALCLFGVTLSLIIHFQQISSLRIKEERERERLHNLELERSHHHAKAEEEQKVRKIYHEMKNLLLAAKLNREETSLLNTVEQELKEYGQYYETGNVFLNVIFKEKLKQAQEKEIDIQLDVDFSAGGFIADRDIVIIYGNALDNAIAACKKLPASERLVTVKTQQIRNMLSIFIENNMLAEDNPTLHTTKNDAFLHGFGLTNIKEAAERYDGTCTIETGKGIFILQILIPIP